MNMSSQWNAVPANVRYLFIKYADSAISLRNRSTPLSECYIDTDEVGRIYLCSQAQKSAANLDQLASGAGVTDTTPQHTQTMPLTKTPVTPASSVTPWTAKPVMDAFRSVGRAMGGPNPLTSTLTGGALGAALGYGGGWLLQKLFPDRYMENGPLARNLAIAGALGLGGASGVFHGLPAYKQRRRFGQGFWGSLGSTALDSKIPTPQSYMQELLKKSQADFNIDLIEDELFEKLAYAPVAGAFVPKIPVNGFNQMVWRDPFLTPQMQAATTGLTSAASTQHGGANLVSPFDIGRIAVGMGSGAVSGMLVGKALGALAGLTPKAQEGIQNAGIFAGLVSNIVPKAFGY